MTRSKRKLRMPKTAKHVHTLAMFTDTYSMENGFCKVVGKPVEYVPSSSSGEPASLIIAITCNGEETTVVEPFEAPPNLESINHNAQVALSQACLRTASACAKAHQVGPELPTKENDDD